MSEYVTIDISTKKYPNTFAIVDRDVFDAASRHKWHYDKGYVRRSYHFTDRKIGAYGRIMHEYLHHFVAGQHGEQFVIDHANGKSSE